MSDPKPLSREMMHKIMTLASDIKAQHGWDLINFDVVRAMVDRGISYPSAEQLISKMDDDQRSKFVDEQNDKKDE